MLLNDILPSFALINGLPLQKQMVKFNNQVKRKADHEGGKPVWYTGQYAYKKPVVLQYKQIVRNVMALQLLALQTASVKNLRTYSGDVDFRMTDPPLHDVGERCLYVK
jgi:hypothetical protein